MSASADGKRIYCDGLGCTADSALPIALHPALTPIARSVLSADRWLFIVKTGTSLHYCPACAGNFLEAPALMLSLKE